MKVVDFYTGVGLTWKALENKKVFKVENFVFNCNMIFRSSNCDDGEIQDIQSDISIEDDVIDLNNKVTPRP